VNLIRLYEELSKALNGAMKRHCEQGLGAGGAQARDAGISSCYFVTTIHTLATSLTPQPLAVS
jgi:hypothetical protein